MGRAWLGTWEAQHASQLRFAKRRAEFLLGRHVAKSAVLEWLGTGTLAQFDIVPGTFQQPILHGSVARPLGVTLAHSGGRAVAVAHELGHPIGVDLEVHDPARVAVIQSQVAATELPREKTLPETELYFLIWAAKEALSKALRCGLTCPFALLAVENAQLDAAGICRGHFANFGQYRFFAWMVGDCAFAVAAARRAEFDPVLSALQQFTRQELTRPQ
jgi:4'-phosphopantetheinyl transferase